MKDSFFFYRAYFEALNSLENEAEQMELMRCLTEYGFNGIIRISGSEKVNRIFEDLRIRADRGELPI